MLPMSARLAVLDFSIFGSKLSFSLHLNHVFQAFPKICKIAHLKACFSIASRCVNSLKYSSRGEGRVDHRLKQS